MSYFKYTFVCYKTECDALLDFTVKDGFGFPNGEVKMICPCGELMSWISANPI